MRQALAQQYFVGDVEQGLSPSNHFQCPVCSYGIWFPFHTLTEEGSRRWRNERNTSKLDAELVTAFEQATAKFLSQNVMHFVLDFHCPKCHAPYAIGFDHNEIRMGDWRYFPKFVWSATESTCTPVEKERRGGGW